MGSASRKKFGYCELCNRKIELTFHHLIPRKLHRRKRFQKSYTREQLANGINICRRCHSGIHKLFDEMTLGTDLNTLERLRCNARVIKHCHWVSRQKTTQD